MSKDPAFLFYTQDFYTGTVFMTDEQVGKYIRLLCLQHQTGHLEEKHMINICKTYDVDIFSKFIRDSEGKYYNERLDNEINRRSKYSESRRENRTSKKTYDKHMETETETETITEDIKNNGVDYEFIVDNYHSLCPKLNKVAVINEVRKGYINARVGEFGMEKVISVLRIAGECEFLNGHNDKAWKADFEWIMRPTNFVKIMEGKYVNAKKEKQDSVFDKYLIKDGK